MPPNIDAHGIRFGFLNAGDFPEFVDHVQTRGKDLSWEAARTVVRHELQYRLSWFDSDGSTASDDWWLSALKMVCDKAGVPEHAAPHMAELVDIESGTFDIEELVEEGCQRWADSATVESTRWLLEEDGWRVLLTMDNGPEIVVEKSPWVVRCKLCSPCCPNGGDLNGRSLDGFWTYCIPPQFLPFEERDFVEPAERVTGEE